MAAKAIAMVPGDPTDPACSNHSANHARAAIATSPHSAAAAPSRALTPGPSGLGREDTGRDLVRAVLVAVVAVVAVVVVVGEAGIGEPPGRFGDVVRTRWRTRLPGSGEVLGGF
jgi:hypothetical protein